MNYGVRPYLYTVARGGIEPPTRLINSSIGLMSASGRLLPIKKPNLLSACERLLWVDSRYFRHLSELREFCGKQSCTVVHSTAILSVDAS
jgi:hypothetical protein